MDADEKAVGAVPLYSPVKKTNIEEGVNDGTRHWQHNAAS